MAVYKRGTTYWIDFYFNGTRHRRPAGEDHKEATKALNRIKGRIADGTFDPASLDPEPAPEKPAGIVFERALELYLEHRYAQGKSPTSYRRLRADWAAVFAGRPVATITADEIEAQLSAWSSERKLAPASRNRALAQLSGFLSYCYGRGWIEAHPTERGRVPKLAEDNARSQWLRLHEIEAIKTAAGQLAGEETDERMATWLRNVLPRVVDFACMTGMRLGEVCALRRASFQEDEQGQTYLITERTKNGERLHWPLEGPALDLVRVRIAAAPFPGSYLFPGPRAGHAYTTLRRVMPDVVAKAGLKYGRKKAGERIPDGITFHTFRHTMASQALNGGIPEGIVQRMGNWKTRTMVARYAHLADSTMRSAAGRLASIIGGSHTVVTSSPEGVTSSGNTGR